ncbi:MAG: hypothetical protein IKE95_04860 [Methanobrevibacter sp.]|nr:hypothetical protein [Methanobrevibacter sp.]
MANEVTKLIMETILALITTAFAFVAGGAWNEAITALLPKDGSGLVSLFIYAITVTIIAVIVTVILARVAAKMGIESDE